MNYDTFTIESESYRKAFWNIMMRGQDIPYNAMEKGNAGSGMFVIPSNSNRIFMDALKDECLFRNIGTSISTADSDLDIWLSDSEDPAEW